MQRVSAVALATLLLFCASGLSQQADSSQPKPSPAAARVLQRFEEIGKLCEAKRYQQALNLLEQVHEMVEWKQLPPAWRAETLYAIGSLREKLGHRQQALNSLQEAFAVEPTKYRKIFNDENVVALHSDRQFRRLLADARNRSGIGPVTWDRSENSQPFPLVFDSRQLPQFTELRREFRIDAAVAGATGDWDRLRRLALWTSRQWEHSSTQMASHTDPLTILREARQGGKFTCMNYAVVLAGVAQAYGMPARVLGLLPRDIEQRADSHSVVEVWLRQYRKWVVADAQYGIVPTVHHRPVSAIELQDALVRGEQVDCGAAAGCARWTDWILEYLYYYKIGRNQQLFSSTQEVSQLILLPKGAPHPRLYNGEETRVFANAVYTSNPDVFYAEPQQAPDSPAPVPIR